jgi:hypothetical protein
MVSRHPSANSITVGSFICYWINYACTQRIEQLGQWDWKLVAIFQLLCPLIILAQLPFIPESPRWHLKKGDEASARAALQRVRDSEQEIEDEILQIKEALAYEAEVVSSTYAALWKDKSVRKRLLLAFCINGGQQITGQGSLNSYSTAIYSSVFTSNSTIQLINALNATFGILFTLNAAWTVDRFGRKFLLIVGGLGMAMCMICVAAVGSETPTIGDDSKSTPVGAAIVFLLFFFTFFCTSKPQG